MRGGFFASTAPPTVTMTRGGKRPGAGRPKGSRTAEPTRVLSVRVPAKHYAYLKGVVLTLVEKLQPKDKRGA